MGHILNCCVCLVWHYVALYDLDVAFHGHYYVRPHLNPHGLVCTSMDFYGLVLFIFLSFLG